MAHLQFMSSSSSCSLSLSFYLSIYPALSLAPSSSRSTDTVQQHILVACSSHRLHRHKNHDDKLEKKTRCTQIKTYSWDNAQVSQI